MFRRKKMYYPAGIISLVLLPILCLWNLTRQKAFEKQGAMDIALFSKTDTFLMAKTFMRDLPLFCNFTAIRFSGEEKNDRLKLAFAKMAITELVKQKDTVNGIHVYFTTKAKYWAFVKTAELNYEPGICTSMSADGVWFYFNIAAPERTMPYFFFCEIIRIQEKKSAKEKILRSLEGFKDLVSPPMTWSMAIYFLMIILTFVKLRSL